MGAAAERSATPGRERTHQRPRQGPAVTPHPVDARQRRPDLPRVACTRHAGPEMKRINHEEAYSLGACG